MTTYDVYRHNYTTDMNERVGAGLSLSDAAEMASLDEGDVLAAIEAEGWAGGWANTGTGGPTVVQEANDQLIRSAAYYLDQ